MVEQHASIDHRYDNAFCTGGEVPSCRARSRYSRRDIIWRKLTIWLVGFTTLGLVITLLVNEGAFLGASRSLVSGSIRLSDLALLAGCIFCADYLADRDLAIRPLVKMLIRYTAVCLLLAGLIVLQPDLSEAALMVAIAMFVLYLAGLPMRFFVILVGSLVLGMWISINLYSVSMHRVASFLTGFKIH